VRSNGSAASSAPQIVQGSNVSGHSLQFFATVTDTLQYDVEDETVVARDHAIARREERRNTRSADRDRQDNDHPHASLRSRGVKS
jgi:hypothetical protein